MSRYLSSDRCYDGGIFNIAIGIRTLLGSYHNTWNHMRVVLDSVFDNSFAWNENFVKINICQFFSKKIFVNYSTRYTGNNHIRAVDCLIV